MSAIEPSLIEISNDIAFTPPAVLLSATVACQPTERDLEVEHLDGVGVNEATFTRRLRSIAEARISPQEAMATLQLGAFDLDATTAKAQRIFADLRSGWNRRKLDAIRGILDHEEELFQLAVPAGFEPA